MRSRWLNAGAGRPGRRLPWLQQLLGGCFFARPCYKPSVAATEKPPAIRVGVSACLLGERCRYDGNDQQKSEIIALASQGIELLPVCPEVECGLPVPRPPMNLRAAPDGSVRLVVCASGEDLTELMLRWARRRAGELAAAELSGFICKSGSPSCGVRGVPLYDAAGGATSATTAGLFAKLIVEHLGPRPVLEEHEVGPGLRVLLRPGK